jgi:hyperosmotically inducible protein
MIRSASFLMAAVLALPVGLAAADKKGHLDPYVQGPADEAGLTQEVRHRLVMLPRFGVFDDIGFNVAAGGTVTLEGQVAQPILKDDAGNVVRRIEGVTNVVNNIEVLPLSPNDDRIRRDVFRAIYGDSSLGMKYGYSALPSIHIIVKNGNVRLEGVVDNEFDRTIAGTRANGVPGAFKVVNDLKIAGK